MRDQLLIGRYDELDRLLLEMENLHELGLKALSFEEVVFNEILADNPSNTDEWDDSVIMHAVSYTHLTLPTSDLV